MATQGWDPLRAGPSCCPRPAFLGYPAACPLAGSCSNPAKSPYFTPLLLLLPLPGQASFSPSTSCLRCAFRTTSSRKPSWTFPLSQSPWSLLPRGALSFPPPNGIVGSPERGPWVLSADGAQYVVSTLCMQHLPGRCQGNGGRGTERI